MPRYRQVNKGSNLAWNNMEIIFGKDKRTETWRAMVDVTEAQEAGASAAPVVLNNFNDWEKSSDASAQIMQQMLTATEKDLTDDLKGLVRLN